MKKKIYINLEIVIESLEMCSDTFVQYLNSETGGIAIVSDLGDSWDEDGSPLLSYETEKFFEDEKYIQLPVVSSREGFDDMVMFIRTVRNPKLKTALENALDKKRPFRRFKDTLMDYPQEEKRWFKFQSEMNYQRAVQWMENNGYGILHDNDKTTDN